MQSKRLILPLAISVGEGGKSHTCASDCRFLLPWMFWPKCTIYGRLLCRNVNGNIETQRDHACMRDAREEER